MRVCIYNTKMKLSSPKTGKGYFLRRLAKEFSLIGIEVTSDPKCKVDITLGIGKFLHKPRGKAVLRLGDIHKSVTENYKKLNKRKAKAVKMADGVIYQSKYSKKLSRHFLGKEKCPSTVIFNGAHPDEFDVEPYESPYKYNFIASTRRWKPQKRVYSIWDAFLEADIPDSCLWICGDQGNTRDEFIHDHNRAIRCLGIVKQKKLATLYKLCDAMIDVTYLSACPNAVVEALIAGTPVIHTDQGGTHEIVGVNGFCLKDKVYKYKVVNLNKPPKIDIHALAKMIKMVLDWKKVEADYLHIHTIAKKYKKFFERILNGKA